MATKLSPAERANRITYFLKGDLKRIQVAYIRAGAKLAQIRDEKLYAALKHTSLEDYAEKRLGLRRAALYRYLQIYDWARRKHRDWFARHPKGFIPELTDAYGLKWIEDRLDDEHVGPETRKELETLRRKALDGTLTQRELDAFRHRGEKHRDSLTAVAASFRAARRRLGALPDVSPALLQEIDVFIDHLRSASGAVARVVRLGNAGGMRLAAIGRRSLYV
jgi:hypothetical protein